MTPCTRCNLTNQHLCNYCHGTGRMPRGGGNALGWIISLVFLIPMAVITAVSSLLISPVLKLYIHSIEPESPKLTFRKAFGLLLKTTFLYQVFNCIIFLVIYFLQKQSVEIPFPDLENLNQSNIYKVIFTLLLLYQVPAILMTGAVLRSKLSGYLTFKKFSGYLRATLFTAIVIMPLILATSYLTMTAISIYILEQPILAFINH